MCAIKFILYSIIFWNIVFSETNDLPNFVKVCKRYDPEASKCWKESFSSLKPYLIKGIPEFDSPPLDPLYVNHLDITQEKGHSLSLSGRIDNVTLKGIGSFEPDHFLVDLKKQILEMVVLYRHIEMRAHYKGGGKVMMFEVDSEGEMECKVDNAIVNTNLRLDIIKKDGKDHLHIKDGITRSKMRKIHVNFDNLFRNNPEITKSVNKAINENMDLLFAEIEPLISSIIHTFATDYIARVFTKYPLDILLPLN